MGRFSKVCMYVRKLPSTQDVTKNETEAGIARVDQNKSVRTPLGLSWKQGSKNLKIMTVKSENVNF